MFPGAPDEPGPAGGMATLSAKRTPYTSTHRAAQVLTLQDTDAPASLSLASSRCSGLGNESGALARDRCAGAPGPADFRFAPACSHRRPLRCHERDGPFGRAQELAV